MGARGGGPRLGARPHILWRRVVGRPSYAERVRRHGTVPLHDLRAPRGAQHARGATGAPRGGMAAAPPEAGPYGGGAGCATETDLSNQLRAHGLRGARRGLQHRRLVVGRRRGARARAALLRLLERRTAVDPGRRARLAQRLHHGCQARARRELRAAPISLEPPLRGVGRPKRSRRALKVRGSAPALWVERAASSRRAATMSDRSLTAAMLTLMCACACSSGRVSRRSPSTNPRSSEARDENVLRRTAMSFAAVTAMSRLSCPSSPPCTVARMSSSCLSRLRQARVEETLDRSVTRLCSSRRISCCR